MNELPLLSHASVEQILAELQRRYDQQIVMPEWCSAIIVTTAGFYSIPVEMVLGIKRDAKLVRVRHLCISLIASLEPQRTQKEVMCVFDMDHAMYRHALAATEERCLLFPEFRAEVGQILQALKSCRKGCGSTRRIEAGAQKVETCQTPPTPVKTAFKTIR